MTNIEVIPIHTRKQMRDFVALPRCIYSGSPQYVPDLDTDVRDTFRPGHNAGLKFCEVQPFVAYRDGVAVGRIAAIINQHANTKWKESCVRFGFIEMVDDREVAAALLQAVERWGAERGMTRIQGPLGITDFDKEGMLVEDFDLRGSMTAIYNPPYYPQHLEALGYTKEVDWLQVRIQVPNEVPARFHRVAEYARTQFGLRVRKLNAKELRGEYALRVFALLNEAYSPLFGFTEFTPDQVREFIKKYLPLVDLRLMPVVENPEGEIVGVAVTMQSMVKALQQSRGRLLPLGWFHLLRALRNNHEDSAEMLLVAVRSDYQGLGVNALFFDDLIPIYNSMGIHWAETGPQLEQNARVLSQWKGLQPTFVKRRRCYSKDIGV